MELREKIARICFDIGKDEMSACDAMADAILAIPELQEALNHICRDQEILTPEQVRQMGRVYGGETTTIRVTGD